MSDTFTLTADHLTLLARVNVRWNGGPWGAPGGDLKRPYGNTDLVLDIANALDIPLPRDRWGEADYDDDDYRTVELKCLKLHRELETAMRLLCLNAGRPLRPGVYRRTTPHDERSWVPVTPCPTG